ncbi:MULTISPECIES: AAWKG family protein [unclassified Streptomyces]|uniref:AAWKG family protein n=1 Tax=unclassified Streptomyces TaxID=2593676 RepID=UPI00382E2D9C
MADEKNTGPEDYWLKAVKLFTGYTADARHTLFDEITGNHGIKQMKVEITEQKKVDSITGNEFDWMGQNAGWNIENTDFVIPFYVRGGTEGVTYYKARFTLLGSRTADGAPKQGEVVGSESTSKYGKELDDGHFKPSSNGTVWNTFKVTKYSFGTGRALGALLHDKEGTIGFTWGGEKVGVSADKGVRLDSFDLVADSFDRVAGFFWMGRILTDQWQDSVSSSPNDAWRGQAAGVFWDLVHELRRRYDNYSEDMEYVVGTSKQGRMVRQAGEALRTQTQNLFNAWERWADTQGNPLKSLSDLLTEIAKASWDKNLTQVDSEYEIYGDTGAWEYTPRGGFTSEATDENGKTYGDMSELDTWKKVGEEAIRRWETGVKTGLWDPAEEALRNLSLAWSSSQFNLGSLNTKGDKGIGDSFKEDKAFKLKKDADDKAAKDKADADAKLEKLKKDADDKAAKDKADADARYEKDKKEALDREARAKAEAEAKQAEAEAKQEQIRKEQEAKQAELERKREEKEREQEAEQAEREAKQEAKEEEQERKQAEREARQEQLRKEQEAKQDQIRAEQEAKQDRLREEQERKQADAQHRAEEKQAEAQAIQIQQVRQQKEEQQRREKEQERKQAEQEAKQDRLREEQEAEQDRLRAEQERKEEEARERQEQLRKEQEAKQDEIRKEQKAEQDEARQKQEQIRAEQERKQEEREQRQEEKQEKAEAKQEQLRKEQEARQDQIRAEQEKKQDEAQDRQDQVRKEQEARQDQIRAEQEKKQDDAQDRQDRIRAEQERKQEEYQHRQEQLSRGLNGDQDRPSHDIGGPGDQLRHDGVSGPVNGDDSLTNPGGSVSHLDSQGRVVTDFPDGSRTVVDPHTQMSTVIRPDGTSYSGPLNAGDSLTNPDGSRTHLDAQGQVVTEYPDGSSARVDADTGATSISGPDGTTTTGYLNDPDTTPAEYRSGGGHQVNGGSSHIPTYDYGSGYEEELYDDSPYREPSLSGASDGTGGGTGGNRGTPLNSGPMPGMGGGPGTGGMPMGGMPMGGMGGMGGQGGDGPSERVRNVIDGDVVSNRRTGASPQGGGAYGERRPVATSGAHPFPSPTGGAGGPGRTETESGDRDREVWEPEDDDVWGTDEGGAPAVIGR